MFKGLKFFKHQSLVFIASFYQVSFCHYKNLDNDWRKRGIKKKIESVLNKKKKESFLHSPETFNVDIPVLDDLGKFTKNEK